MKIIPKEEADQYPMLRQGRHTAVHVLLLQLKPGEKLIINIGTDWLSKTTPHKLVREFARKRGWKLVAGHSPDKKTWIVRRVE